MPTQILEYVSCSKLCPGCPPTDVIICVSDTSLLSFRDCPGETANVESWIYRSFPAQILSESKVCGGCNPNAYLYNLSFDTSYLAEDVNFTSTNISGIICVGCFTNYAEDLAGREVQIVTDEEGLQYLTSQHGCTYALTSADLGITVDDTDSVNLTLTGSLLTADVNISANDCNAISIESDGLFAKGIQAGTTDSTITNLTTENGCNFLDVDLRINANDGNTSVIGSPGLYSGILGNGTSWVPTITTDNGVVFTPGISQDFLYWRDGNLFNCFVNFNGTVSANTATEIRITYPPGIATGTTIKSPVTVFDGGAYEIGTVTTTPAFTYIAFSKLDLSVWDDTLGQVAVIGAYFTFVDF